MISSPPVARHELVARLRAYLSDLSAESRAALVRSIDRSRARGENSPVHAIIMEAVRDLSAPARTAERDLSAERTLFDPVEPYLLSTPMPEKMPGRIERRSLRAIWIWITRDLAPGRLDEPLAALRAAVTDDDGEETARAMQAFRKALVSAARAEMSAMRKASGSLQRLEGQLGSAQILGDLIDALAIFEQQPVLEAFFRRLPDRLPVGQEALEAVKRAFKVYEKEPRADPLFAFAALTGRLGSPADLVRFAVHYAQSTDPAVIRQTRAARAIDMAVSEASVEAATLAHLLSTDRTIGRVAASLKRFDDIASALSRTLEDVPSDPWLRQLTSLRVATGERIATELDPLVRIVKGVVGIVEVRGRQVVPDTGATADAVFGLTLFVAARDARGALALNAKIDQIEKAVENVLENQGRQAIERLATTPDDSWEAALARARAAVQLFRAYHGAEYGAAMAKRLSAIVDARVTAKAS